MRGLTEVFDGLTDEYQAWCAKNGLPCLDAMELIHASYCSAEEGGIALSGDQRKWASDFIQRWEKAERDEREFLRA